MEYIMSTRYSIALKSGRFLSIPLLLALLILQPVAGQAELVDRILAIVNEDVITLSEVNAEGEELFNRIIATTPEAALADKIDEARDKILNGLIDKRLIEQKAATLKLTVADAEVDAAFNDILRRNGMKKEALLAKLQESGMSEKLYRASLKSQLLQNKIVGTDVRSKIVVTEEMVRAHYDEKYTSRIEAGSFYLLQMGFSWRNSSRTEAMEKAERIHALAVSGQDFSTLARKFSELPSKVDGGDIGTFQLDEMAGYMQDAVANLTPGSISDIIETPSGYQFFKLLSSGNDETVNTVAYDSVKDKIKQQLFEKEMKEAYSSWVRELKNQAYIQKL